MAEIDADGAFLIILAFDRPDSSQRRREDAEKRKVQRRRSKAEKCRVTQEMPSHTIECVNLSWEPFSEPQFKKLAQDAIWRSCSSMLMQDARKAKEGAFDQVMLCRPRG